MNAPMVVEPAHPNVATLTASSTVHAIVPQTFDDVWRMAQLLAKSGLVPYGMNTPEKLAVAIMHGLELGVKPLQAIQGIAVINGMPRIWGDLALAVVRSSRELERFKEWHEGPEPQDWERPQGDELNYKALCLVKRKGEEEIVAEFSIRDAQIAKLWMKRGGQAGDKDTPWVTNPKRMLKMRARGFALRDTFADVLKGMLIAEELIGSEEEVDYTPVNTEPPRPPRIALAETQTEIAATTAPVAAVDDAGVGSPAPQPMKAPASAPSPEPEDEFDPEAALTEIEEHCAAAQTAKDVEEIRDLFSDDWERFTRTQQEKADYLLEEALKRITKPKRESRRKTAAEREEGRKRVESAGGKGAREYLDDDRADDDLAQSVEQDPFAIVETFDNEEAWAAHIRRAIAAASSVEHIEKLKAVWNATKAFRQAAVSPPLRTEVQKEAVAKMDEIAQAADG
ncbi:recombinase RecT [Microvirga massiliensis]|uniref:recombinase RecT n=1 Tax=Microvirga massiliensis TaxID=1033741 RepID=UPI00065FB3D4|nr:recombinase RecT [Microvirga massiliensis]